MVAMALAGFVAIGLLIAAQDNPKKREFKDRADMQGTIVCIGCALEKGEGADAQCTLHAKHAQGFLMTDGTLWTFVDNARGHAVIANDKLRGKEVGIFGWKYSKSQYIEIWKYRIKEGEKWVAYDYCKLCGFEPGDLKDKELCEDCAGEK
ncbi:MAG: hypothetical protein A2Z34_07890 [Planctomycetes bacterium RBG_16_59_8]|nr:MAG: hypothetical protein A2Z34_07890 [Planctomycetes bacterium RBG_16_59_8]